MRRICSIALSVLVAAVAGVSSAQALASPPASMHGCRHFRVTYNRDFGGQQWTYRALIQAIKSRGIRCNAVGALIERFDNYIVSKPGGWNVGVYYTVPFGPWRCRAFRPYDRPNFLENEDCKKGGGGRVIWQEMQLSARQTG